MNRGVVVGTTVTAQVDCTNEGTECTETVFPIGLRVL